MTTERLSRRTALKFAGIITLAAQGWRGFPSDAIVPTPRGYGTDPNLLERHVTWPRTLDAAQLAMLAPLCDLILPAEPPHPSASAIGVHEFIDEWISAPYPQMQADRALILAGLPAFDDVTRQKYGRSFSHCGVAQQAVAFDQLCSAKASAAFPRRLIELVCGGYYTTREGHAAIGYVGNVALASFPAPPADVVRHLEEQLEHVPTAFS